MNFLVCEHCAVVIHVLGPGEIFRLLVGLKVEPLVDDLVDHRNVGVVEVVGRRDHRCEREAPPEAPRADLRVEVEKEVSVERFGLEQVGILAEHS